MDQENDYEEDESDEGDGEEEENLTVLVVKDRGTRVIFSHQCPARGPDRRMQSNALPMTLQL